MSQAEKVPKISKVLRGKAQEFLASPANNADHLIEIVRHFESGADLPSCLLTLELIFTNLLKDRAMFVPVVPLKPTEQSDENLYKQWLRTIYEGCFTKVVDSLSSDSHKIQLQGKPP